MFFVGGGGVCFVLFLIYTTEQLIGLCDGLYMLGPESGTIRRYDVAGVGVSLRHGLKTRLLASWKPVLY